MTRQVVRGGVLRAGRRRGGRGRLMPRKPLRWTRVSLLWVSKFVVMWVVFLTVAVWWPDTFATVPGVLLVLALAVVVALIVDPVFEFVRRW